MALLSETLRSFVPADALLWRLGERGASATPSPSCLADDAAVGAVADAGSLTGLVGDFGRGFLAPGGDVGAVFFVGLAAVVFEGVGLEVADLAAAIGAFAAVLSRFVAFCKVFFGCGDGSLGLFEAGEGRAFGEATLAGSWFWDVAVTDAVGGVGGDLTESLSAVGSPDVAFANFSVSDDNFCVWMALRD